MVLTLKQARALVLTWIHTRAATASFIFRVNISERIDNGFALKHAFNVAWLPWNDELEREKSNGKEMKINW